jgi:hypothetical protein
MGLFLFKDNLVIAREIIVLQIVFELEVSNCTFDIVWSILLYLTAIAVKRFRSQKTKCGNNLGRNQNCLFEIAKV